MTLRYINFQFYSILFYSTPLSMWPVDSLTPDLRLLSSCRGLGLKAKIFGLGLGSRGSGIGLASFGH